MSLFDKFRVQTAMPNRRKHVCESQHITTSDFFQLCPVYVKELVPNTSFKLDTTAFGRLSSLAVPTYGRASLNLHAFFVPFSYVWRPWHAFITGTPYVGQSSRDFSYEEVPVIYNSSLCNVFINDAYMHDGINGFARPATPGDDNVDFAFVNYNSSGVQTDIFPVILLPYGRLFYKVLLSLGYNISTNNRAGTSGQVKYNALPLLCYLRCWFDYFQPSQYANSTKVLRELGSLFNLEGTEDTSVALNALFNNPWTDDLSIYKIFPLVCTSNYKDDYFTSAWENPVSPTINTQSGFVSIPDVTGSVSGVSTLNPDGNTTPTIQSTEPTPYLQTISQYVIDSLKRLTDFVNRNRLSGGHFFDRYRSRFGMDLSHADTRQAYYLGCKNIDITIGDVFSTADTEGAGLGDFAGRGYLSDNADFSVDTKDEYGIFLVFESLIPNVGYYQGIERSVLQRTRFDFWSPEFDNMGTQAISKAELYMPVSTVDDLGQLTGNQQNCKPYVDGIFGFTPRYSQYKFKQSQLTGDFRLPSIATGKESWHLFRQFEFTNTDDIEHSYDFVRGLEHVDLSGDASDYFKTQYDRIFQFNGQYDNADHFTLFFGFRFTMESPLKSLFDVYDFDDEQGKQIISRLNGTQLS